MIRRLVFAKARCKTTRASNDGGLRERGAAGTLLLFQGPVLPRDYSSHLTLAKAC